MKSRLPLESYIAWRYMTANVKQSLLIALAVGLGVSIVIFIPSVNLSFFGYFLEKTVEDSAHIRVTRELDTFDRNEIALKEIVDDGTRLITSDQTLTRRRNIKAFRRLMTSIETIPGVDVTAPYISEQIIITHGSQVRGATLTGMIPELEQRIRNVKEDVAEGNLDTLASSEVFLGWRLADELGVDPGNRIQLVTSQGNKSFKVAGLMNTGIYGSDMDTVILSLKGAQNLLDMGNEVTGISIRINDIYQAMELSELIANTYQLKSRNWMEDNEVILDQIGMFRVIIAFISVLIIFAAATSITSVLIMVVSSKSKEIGVLKAMGTSGGQIMRIFLIQSVFLGILGCIAGVFGGMGLIELYNATPYSKAETFLGIGRQPVTINLEYTFYAIFYAMMSAIIASIIPAWQASKLDPVEAINQ